MLLFVDKLINVDFSYLDEHRGLVGETWIASVELEGGLDAQGMVCDFGIVKKTIREWLDTQIDHRLLIPQKSACLRGLKQEADLSFQWHSTIGQIELQSPASAITLIPQKSIDPNSIASWCVTQLMRLFPSSVKNISLRFENENIIGPFYHYSHGLKKHSGNCQRIAHGHKSKIEIWIDDKPATKEMQTWASNWQDIYIGSEDDINHRNDSNIAFKYSAQQGEFQLSLPKEKVYLIPSDSTVELIAEHLANKLADKYPKSKIRVKAYEGMGKGAIATREQN